MIYGLTNSVEFTKSLLACRYKDNGMLCCKAEIKFSAIQLFIESLIFYWCLSALFHKSIKTNQYS